MKRSLIFLLILVFVLPLVLKADDNRDKGKSRGSSGSSGQSSQRSSRPAKQQGRQPVVINLSKSSSGGHNRNYPSQQKVQQQKQQPSYGKLNWQGKQTRTSVQVNQQRVNVKVYSSPGVKAASVAHHHPYTQGYVRNKLKKIGVKSEPNYITDRAEIIHTDRQHSIINMPKEGLNREALHAAAISPRHFNDKIVRGHMAMISSSDWRARAQGLNMTETRANFYYWHKDNGFNYCHYVDGSGYHWYGWYIGNKFFWNRNYNGRWWWYDSGYDRWCFWNDGFWWWQDPYHVGDLYCYNDDTYIPANSAEDPVVVTGSESAATDNYPSPDGTRVVKVDKETQDAYLNDTANPPTFNPIYLASGVKNIQFSNTNNGRPLEIILTLNDGSFDMFDGQGNPYNAGSSNNDQENQQSSDSNQPPDNGAPPQGAN